MKIYLVVGSKESLVRIHQQILRYFRNHGVIEIARGASMRISRHRLIGHIFPRENFNLKAKLKDLQRRSFRLRQSDKDVVYLGRKLFIINFYHVKRKESKRKEE